MDWTKLQSQQWKYILLLLIVAILTILFTLIVIPPAAGYEYSLHDIYPPYFWIITGIIAISPLIYLGITHKYPQHFSWKSACILTVGAVFNRLIYSYLPLIRGYFSYSAGDLHSHYGSILQILDTGFFGSNHYPYVHTAITEIVDLCNISKEVAVYHFSAISTLVFLILFIPIGKYFLKNQKYTIFIITMLALPVGASELLSPNGWCYYFLVFYLYLIYRTICDDRKHAYLLITIMFSVLGWFIHPEFVLYSLLILGIMTLSYYIYQRFSHLSNDSELKKINHLPLLVISLVLLIGFIYLFSRTGLFSGQINLFSTILQGGNVAEESIASQATEHSIFTIIRTGYITYGRNCIVAGVTLLITFAYLIHSGWKKIPLLNLTLILIFIGYSIFALVNMFLGTTIGVNPARMLKYIYLFSILMLAAYGIPYLLSSPQTILKRLLTFLLIIMILHTTVINIEKAYGNPMLHSSNYPIIKQDYLGMDTFFEYRSDSYLIEEVPSRYFQQRYSDYIFGMKNPNSNNIRSVVDIINEHSDEIKHLGYNYHLYSGNRYDNKRYQLLYHPIGLEYKDIFYRQYTMGSITNEDLYHFKYDISAIKTQDNGQFQVYLTQPITKQTNNNMS